ncbi:ubiquitin carboxyl-terminal hydrolase [Thraustotheca clavata]|uniref:Ubiquitin carboxyl-terminal hydrolase n=1 Tax=Thraustotheca clavata TaxID=74557 RepID=A0A1V9ZQ06_9STRA|nr:ubiquitin carboxyl-terminal hydrolase [Thraustotheca clavata]
MVAVTLKWGKQTFPLEIDLMNGTVADLRAQIYSLTFVPIERQKLMSKAWKGMLKDDVALSTLDTSKLTQIMLMGSAEEIRAPAQKTIFTEDLSSSELASAGVTYPAGLVNLGNTCYMNATLQCLRYAPDFRDALKEYKGGLSADLAHNFTSSLRDMYAQLDANIDSIPPMMFVDTLRRAFPQFAQQQPRGGYMQQDSDEFVSALFNTLARQLKAPTTSIQNISPADNMIDALFGLEMEERLECTETDAEPITTKKEKALKLVCNITKDTNHISEGITVGLEGTIEKNSEILGRNAVWKKSMKINRLPKYICVQFMRFYWKLTPESRDHTGVKCKMLRPISFPQILDVFPFCSEELKAVLKVGRDKNADLILNEFKDKKPEAKEDENVDMEQDLSEEDKAALEMAKTMSMANGRASAGIGLSLDFQGNYELFAVVTHKGRSADSGHYIGWARVKDDDWLCFDDDNVSPCKTEDIQKLKGGGDWHMAYLTFYRAKN